MALTLLPVVATAPAQAVTRAIVKVSRSVSAATALTGDKITVAGRVTPAPTNAPVRLQRYQGGRWVTLQVGRVAANDSYRFATSSRTSGSWKYRVYSAADGGRRAAASLTFGLRFLACNPGVAPLRGTTAWFTRPGLPGVNPVSAQLTRLFCSAARGSTIDISMYFIRAAGDQADVDPILTALSRVVKYRGVKVRVLLEGRLYARGQGMNPSLAPLRRFATVILCQNGCHNDRAYESSGHGIMHQKFITISDMSWKSGRDPAVVVSSANWSQSQLDRFWQSAVLFHDDDPLYREFDIQFELLAACAKGCATWANRMVQLKLPSATYGLVNSAGLWRDMAPARRNAAAGSGRSVVFSPWSQRDPIAVALRGYTCTPTHRTVLIDHMFITGARQTIIDALTDLHARGCRVEIILRQLGESPLLDGINRVRSAGLKVGCVPRMHGKVIMIDAVRTSDGRPDKAVWIGSQSLGGKALKNNDETLLQMSTADASGAARLGNTALYNKFVADWQMMNRQKQVCR